MWFLSAPSSTYVDSYFTIHLYIHTTVLDTKQSFQRAFCLPIMAPKKAAHPLSHEAEEELLEHQRLEVRDLTVG